KLVEPADHRIHVGHRFRWQEVGLAPLFAGSRPAGGLGQAGHSFRFGPPGQARGTAPGRSAEVRNGAYLTVMVPFMSAEWPGKLQKNEFGPAPSLATGKVTEVLSPPPTSFECAMTRLSPTLT